MTHPETINGKQVIFETVQVAERFDHSTEYFMYGYTGDQLTHTAIGSFAIGSDDFEEISYIEVVCDECGDTGRGKPTLQEPDGIDCEKCSSK